MAPVIGRFEIVREIGKSDLGTVYEAYDPKKKHTVALRVLRADTPQAIERSREYLLYAKVASVLDSPNIVRIYDGAEEQGLAYVVMELVEGVPLDVALATQQGFSSSELLDISRQVCGGLDHAHSNGIFHRGLTPAGILTEWDGTVKILDFAAGLVETQTGDDLHYLSPEQVQGRVPDARSNVFNWGAILYEMVTGRKAFGEGDAAAVQDLILEVMPPAPQEVGVGMSAGISRVIMKALAKNPEYRFQHAGDLVSELEAECDGANRMSLPGVPQVNVPPPAPPPAPRMEAGPPSIPGLPAHRGGEILAPAAGTSDAPAASAAANAPHSESLLGYEVPATSAATWAESTAAVAPPVIAKSTPAKPTAAPPPVPRPATAGSRASLTSRQIKILAAVVGTVLLGMVIVMVGAAMHARRLRAGAEAAAIAPLTNKGAPDPITAAGPPVSELAVPVPAEPEPTVIPTVPRAKTLKARHKAVATPTKPRERTPKARNEAVAMPAEPEPTVIPIVPRARTPKARNEAVASPAAPALGELVVNSVPQGAQVQVDGNGAGLTPAALAKEPLVAMASIASEPPGAAIIIDGRDTGKVTPAKVVVEKGSHSLSLRKPGYLETSASMALNPGETLQFQPTLKPLGNADDIKQVGKLKKLIGHGGQEHAARVMVRTSPKGAQIMFNSRMMDRASPAEFQLGPGIYEVTLTLTGYKTVHKTITVESNGRTEVNEPMER